MCGIAGVLLRDPSRRADPAWLEGMVDVLRHRGPDGTAITVSDNVGLANARLAIIDAHGGAQPMESADGTLCVTFNGAIFNFVELRAELAAQGRRLRTSSDTEVLLHLYERDGAGMVDRLNGMFAFALHDRRRRRLLLARDRLGEKPLYVFEDGERVAFASEIKALLTLPGVRAEAHPAALAEYLTLQYCLGDRTLFRGVRRLLPARYVELDASGAARETQYWTLPPEGDECRPQEVAAELRELLADAVRVRLRSDVPVGYLVSGGLDSTLVAALAGGRGPAFTARAGDGPAYDELPHAAEAARGLGLVHHAVDAPAEALAERLPEIIRHLDEPAAGPAAFPLLLVAELAREHVGVVLGGQGADETFGGYARYGLLAGGAVPCGYEPLAKEFRRRRAGDAASDYLALVSRAPDLERYLCPGFRDALAAEGVPERFRAEFEAPETSSPLARAMAYDLRVGLQSLLHVEDRMTMAASLEARQPFLDHRVVELAARVPVRHRRLGGGPKGMLRTVASGLVPPSVLARRDKLGLPVPWVEWARGPLADFVHDLLLGPRARARGLFEPRAVEELVGAERPYGRALWGLVCLELWFREFVDA